MENENENVLDVLAGLASQYKNAEADWVRRSIDTDDWWQCYLDERELKETALAMLYAVQFHHGTDGHNRLMLIAKLTSLVNVYGNVIHALVRYLETGEVS